MTKQHNLKIKIINIKRHKFIQIATQISKFISGKAQAILLIILNVLGLLCMSTSDLL